VRRDGGRDEEEEQRDERAHVSGVERDGGEDEAACMRV